MGHEDGTRSTTLLTGLACASGQATGAFGRLAEVAPFVTGERDQALRPRVALVMAQVAEQTPPQQSVQFATLAKGLALDHQVPPGPLPPRLTGLMNRTRTRPGPVELEQCRQVRATLSLSEAWRHGGQSGE